MTLGQRKRLQYKNAVSGKRKQKVTTTEKAAVKRQVETDRKLAELSSQVDKAFEQFYFEMDKEETKTHMIRLIYYMLGGK